jgi:VIT1/CCC1 family predicted Fe2+/Mn2+ transporter
MRALMTKANTIAEIVSVESELTRRESDLEALLAKQKNLSLQTDLATLTVTLTEKGKPPVVTEPTQDKGFLAGLKGGWNAFTAVFSALATAVGAMLPFLVLLAIIAVPLWRYRHRLLRKQPTAGQ